MKKVLMLATALLALSMITTVISPATEYPDTGYVEANATASPNLKIKITKDLVLHIRGAEGAGPIFSDYGFPGTFQMTLSADIDLNTGEGSMHGRWAVINEFGTFEGSFRTTNYGVVYYEGTAVGQGTGGYEGMLLTSSFSGYNLYLIGGPSDPNDPGVYFEYVNVILSPHGVAPPPL